ncbi:MerR family DNA-binding transcriptional regulator [Microbacterium sp. I2]|uniref:MerR family DNA-binding transcriptional regulator n=1 Tax=Microbacterium sp. I2 TaxID=3391826 RepID=UPI003ED9C786
MSGIRIAEAAKRSGLPTSTIRFYEAEGLLSPAVREPNGYRVYREADLARLTFLAGAKRLHLSLPEMRQLVGARESDLCMHVQGDMRAVVRHRLEEIEAQIAELTGLADELRRTEHRLAGEAPTGTCSDACAHAALGGGSVVQPVEPPADAAHQRDQRTGAAGHARARRT